MKRYLLLFLMLIIIPTGCTCFNTVKRNDPIFDYSKYVEEAADRFNKNYHDIELSESSNNTILKDEKQSLYIKNVSAELIDTGIKISFITTVPSVSSVTLIKDEKKWFTVRNSNSEIEHIFAIKRIEGVTCSAIIEAYSADLYDKSTISFTTGYKVISDSVQQVGYDSTQYTNPGKYDGSPSPCANGCR